MKRILIFMFAAVLFAACHEDLADRAAREAKEFTEKNCPTPVENFTRTDSVVFDKATTTYHYYCTLTDNMDDSALIATHKDEIIEGLTNGLRQSTDIKIYKEAGFNFAYTCHSQKNPQQVLLDAVFTKKDYGK